MKLLYLDFLYPKGHIRQNTAYVNNLSKIGKVYLLSPIGRYKNLFSEVEVIEKKSLNIKNGKLLGRLSSLKIMFLSALISRKLKPDYIFVSSYETITFIVGRLFFSRKVKIFLLHHCNIDELDNGFKSWIFKRYMRKVDHIVFEDFIKDYLISTFNLNANRIHVLPHQLNKNILKFNKQKYNCVGLSSSNDENIISEIVEIEKKQQILKKNGCRVVLKSKSLEFDNGFLKVFNNFLDNAQYNEYINNSLCIYMPFPLSFRFRMSGTLVDSLSNNKIILGPNIPLILNYALNYPEVCKVVNSTDDLFNCLFSLGRIEEDKQIKDFEQFRINHSEEKIVESFIGIFSKNEIFDNSL